MEGKYERVSDIEAPPDETDESYRAVSELTLATSIGSQWGSVGECAENTMKAGLRSNFKCLGITLLLAIIYVTIRSQRPSWIRNVVFSIHDHRMQPIDPQLSQHRLDRNSHSLGRPLQERSSYNPSLGPVYNPSGGPQYNPSAGPRYNPSGGPQYNPSAGPRYNPSGRPQYNPSGGPVYNPSAGPRYNPMPEGFDPSGAPNPWMPRGFDPSAGPGYNPWMRQGFIPSAGPGYNPSMRQGFDPSAAPRYNPSMRQGFISGPRYNPWEESRLAETILRDQFIEDSKKLFAKVQDRNEQKMRESEENDSQMTAEESEENEAVEDVERPSDHRHQVNLPALSPQDNETPRVNPNVHLLPEEIASKQRFIEDTYALLAKNTAPKEEAGREAKISSDREVQLV